MIRDYAHAAQLQHKRDIETYPANRTDRTVMYVAGKGDFKGTTINLVQFRFIEVENDDGSFDYESDDDVEIMYLWDAEENMLPNDSILKAIAKRDILKSLQNWYPDHRPYPSEEDVPKPPDQMNNEEATEWFKSQRGAQ